MSRFQKSPHELRAQKKSDQAALWVSAIALVVVMIIGYLTQ